MCTAINFLNQKHENAFGRTMDFQYVLDPCLVAFPAGAAWENVLGQICTDRYGVAGIARHVKNLYVMFDGVNERGLQAVRCIFTNMPIFCSLLRRVTRHRFRPWIFSIMLWVPVSSLDDLRLLLTESIQEKTDS